MSGTNKQPFELLGTQLKNMRQKRQESLADVSGAVEIEPNALQAIEQGSERPGEEILLLLISYFAAKEDTATKLWQLAGYDEDELPIKSSDNFIETEVKKASQNLPNIVYTDMVHVIVNNYGVVMEFMQRGTSDDQPMAVSRVGMSKEHAKSVIDMLEKSLSSSKTKQLDQPKTKASQSKKHRK